MYRHLIWIVFVFFALDSVGTTANDRDEIKKIIPSDSAMSPADFEKIATSKIARSPSATKDRSLTWALLNLKPKKTDQAKNQFLFLQSNPPDPAKLAAEIARPISFGKKRLYPQPITFIHADRITGFGCMVESEKATGWVSFKVPDLYQGKVNFKAKKNLGKWQITEFMVPAYAIHLIQSEKGLWKEKK